MVNSAIKQERLQNIFNKKSGNAVIIPLDYGLYMGSVKGIEDPVKIVNKLIDNKVDGTIMGFGLGKVTANLFYTKKHISKILSVDYMLMSTMPGMEEGIFGNILLSSVEQAIKWGFDAIKAFLIWGVEPNLQLQNIKYIGKLARSCDKYDMPLIIEPLLIGKNIPENKRNDPKLIMDTCRIAMEMGADILKISYPGDKESFSQIVKNSYIPVVILGGPKREGKIKEMLQMTKSAIEVGGKGIVFGRNVWQSYKMDNIISALKDIVHNNNGVDEVLEKYNL